MANGITIGVSVAFLLWRALHTRGRIRYRICLSFAILLTGAFVLRLAPQEAQPDRVLWVSSLELFGSRMLPLVGLLTLLFAVHRMPNTASIQLPFRRWLTLSRTAYTAVGAGCAFLLSWLMAEFGYGALPVVDDGVAHLFQARIFASGHLALRPPPHPEAFRFFGLIQEPGWMAMFPPGYPAVLSLAVLLGGISLINPILTALTVPAIELIAYRCAGRKVAAITVLLFVFSPFVPVVGGSFRSHSLTLLLLAWSTGLLLDPGLRRWAILLSGGCAGLAFLVRPYTAFLWCAGLVLGVIICRREKLWRTVPLFALSALPGIILAFLYNLVQTGGEIVPAPIYLYGEKFGLGFGPRAMGEHTVIRAISHTTTRIEALGRMIMGWPFPLHFLPLAVLALPGQPLPSRGTKWILLLPAIFVVLGYSLYWCLEFTHGPRFVFCILATILPLIAESLLVLRERLCALLQSLQCEAVTRALTTGLLLSLIYSGAITWPQTLKVFGSYRAARPDIADRVRDLPAGKALIFYSPRSEQDSGFGAGLVLNAQSLAGELIVALDVGEERNREVIELFPGRSVYRYRFEPGLGLGSLEPYQFLRSD
jgi:hypothetical protein